MNVLGPLMREDVLGITGERVPFDEVKQRILQACRTLRALPDPERKFQTMHNGWPEIVREVSEAYGYDQQVMPRFRPSPADVSDCLTALAWANGLSSREFRLVWLMSYGLSYRQIGMRMYAERGRPYSDERARQLCRDVLLKCWRTANS